MSVMSGDGQRICLGIYCCTNELTIFFQSRTLGLALAPLLPASARRGNRLSSLHLSRVGLLRLSHLLAPSRSPCLVLRLRLLHRVLLSRLLRQALVLSRDLLRACVGTGAWLPARSLRGSRVAAVGVVLCLGGVVRLD